MEKFVIGLLAVVIGPWIVLYLRRARLTVTFKPNFGFASWHSGYPVLDVTIDNQGYTRAQITKTMIQFKGGNSSFQQDIQQSQNIVLSLRRDWIYHLTIYHN